VAKGRVPMSGDTSRLPRRGLLRRGLRAPGAPSSPREWACPDCGLATRDPVAMRLGFCARCREFTGMCAAGRKIVCPDMMTLTVWHTPCTSLGATAWQITQAASPCVAMLCAAHDAELRSGQVPWISYAIPLSDLAGPEQA
jgi:hypothetical protein